MAIIFGVLDPSAERRAQLVRRLPPSLSGMPQLVRKTSESPNLSIFWEAPDSTPVSVAATAHGAAARSAFVVGDFDAPYSTRFDAGERLLKMAEADPGLDDPSYISGRDGYYMAMLCEHGTRIVLGTDALGMFPLYYWTQDDIFLFGTSPELFKHHPLFTAAVSLYGIASILLVNHISGGQSLFQNVRRSTPGKYISWSAVNGLVERDGNPLRMSDAGFDLSYPETKARIFEIFDRFHAPLGALPDLQLSLSGGQDSRLLAGFIAKHTPAEKVVAVSTGQKGDTELDYTQRVARSLGWRHEHADIEPEHFPATAMRQLQLETLQGPFASFHSSTVQRLLSQIASPFISGYAGDPVIGDKQILLSASPKTGEFNFHSLMAQVRRYGFSIDETAELLSVFGPASRELPMAVIEALHLDWNSIDGANFQKPWLFQLQHRVRFHVGSLIWRLSLGAWHLVPYLSRPLLDTCAQMPLSHLRERRIQADLIKSEFPRLARLPLDRNARHPGYIVQPPLRRFIDGLPKLEDFSWRMHQFMERHYAREQRYYHRIYDFNAPGWREVRQQAERHRAGASTLLNATALERLLPPAESTPEFSDNIVDASKVKTLAGIVLWTSLGNTTPGAQDDNAGSPIG